MKKKKSVSFSKKLNFTKAVISTLNTQAIKGGMRVNDSYGGTCASGCTTLDTLFIDCKTRAAQ